MDNNLSIRLVSHNWEDTQNANVAFDLCSTGHTVGESAKQEMRLVQQVPAYRSDKGELRYSEITREAAGKLRDDFRRIADRLDEIAEGAFCRISEALLKKLGRENRMSGLLRSVDKFAASSCSSA